MKSMFCSISSGLFFKTSEGFVCGGHALRETQDCRASSWGPCVAWDSLTFKGPYSAWGSLTRQPLLQGEVGGWQWLSGVRRGVGRKARAHLITWLWLRLHCL